MTLAIAIAAPTMVHLAVDARITYLNSRGRPYKWADKSPKLTRFRQAGLHGFVTWSGMGEWDRVDLADWVAEELRAAAAAASLDLEAVISSLENAIETRLSTNGAEPHTFLIGAVEKGVPSLVMLSNHRNLRGEECAASDLVIEGEPWRRRVVILGAGGRALRDEDRRVLRAISKHQPPMDGNRRSGEWARFVRTHLAGLIGDVSRSRSGWAKTVSPKSNRLTVDLDGTSGEGNAPFATEVTFKGGTNPIAHFVFLKKKVERGEMTWEEANTMLNPGQPGSGQSRS